MTEQKLEYKNKRVSETALDSEAAGWNGLNFKANGKGKTLHMEKS